MISQKQLEMWESYKYNHSQYLFNEIRQLQQNIRYRNIDHIDCLELICAVERLQSFEDFCKTTDVIFNIKGYKPSKTKLNYT